MLFVLLPTKNESENELKKERKNVKNPKSSTWKKPVSHRESVKSHKIYVQYACGML